MIGICFSISGIIFLSIFMVCFFSKNSIKSDETKLYGNLLIITFIGSLIDIFSFILYKMGVDVNSLLYTLLAKGMLVYFVAWVLIFTSYVYAISKNSIIKYRLIIFKIIFVLSSTSVLSFPIDFKKTANAVYPSGLGVNLTYLIVGVFLTVSIVLTLRNITKEQVKKYIPIFLVIIMLISATLVQKVFPDSFLINFSLVTVVSVMYFTIENPDMKMVEELEKNRKLIDRNIEEKSNLLFELSHEVREPLKKINEISYNYKNTNNVEELQESLKEINEKANDMSLLVNDILDISITSRKNMQIYEETYNPESLFKKLLMKFKEEKNNRITFSYAIPESMPKELYGDSVKIKQIVNTVLTNAFKYTKEGYVDLKVTSINKYDIARLIITVEDTGCGMSIDKVNDILNNNKEFSKEELNNLEKINIGIKLANKLVIEMGGILVIKSEENKGTKVTIIIDEQIKEDSYNKMLEEDNYLRNTKIAILGDKTRKINKIRDLMKQYEVKTYLEKEELIEQIKKKEKYDLIILFDDMKPSGIEVLKSLKEIKGYKTPTVVLLEDNKISIKEHYIKDGFTEYLLLSDINEEIKKLDKYLKG